MLLASADSQSSQNIAKTSDGGNKGAKRTCLEGTASYSLYVRGNCVLLTAIPLTAILLTYGSMYGCETDSCISLQDMS
jgi:hypothetical protein